MCGIVCLIQYSSNPIDPNLIASCLDKLSARGPDKSSSHIIDLGVTKIFMGFTRLAIMDTSVLGQQPFVDNPCSGRGNTVICNGEIYNYKDLIKKYNIITNSSCDCEVILPLYKQIGFDEMTMEIDAEFAMVLYDAHKNIIYAARDKFGVRPLYYGYNKEKRMIGFASEMKVLHDCMEFVDHVNPNEIMTINPYDFRIDIDEYDYVYSMHDGFSDIKELLISAVRKRLSSDVPIGFLLSGGLDSSLIVSIAAGILGPDNITCFSIGLEGSPDIEAAKKVVEYLGIIKHHIIPFTINEGLAMIPDVIKSIESYDITTIRASTPQYIMANYIKKNTNIKVLLSGEGSDEIHGSYKYFRNAPSPEDFHKERTRLLEELYMFDNLRTDRTMAHFGLEVRVPFLDIDYVTYVMGIDPSLLMYSVDCIEKKIVRDRFKGYLPDEILYRPKEAFSDAVSNAQVNWYHSIIEYANQQEYHNEFYINKPESKEALYYRTIFDKIYPGRDNIIKHYWMPRFQNTKITDPSATILNEHGSC